MAVGAVADPNLELSDPTPDIWALFDLYNTRFFNARLGAVSVEWSKRLTSCAGLCYYRGRSGGCEIRLSSPLLSFRTRRDMIDTLLHEMIHAYLFVVEGNMERDKDGHGAKFQGMMRKINAEAGTSITIYHSFHDEVDYHRKHWWLCDGVCKNRPPYFGHVKRAMNRAPGPNDLWWAEHQRTCGGKFVKIKEPPATEKKPKGPATKKPKLGNSAGAGQGQSTSKPKQGPTIQSYFKKVRGSSPAAATGSSSSAPMVLISSDSSEDEDDMRRKKVADGSTSRSESVIGTVPTSGLNRLNGAINLDRSQPKLPQPSTHHSDNPKFPGAGYRLGSS